MILKNDLRQVIKTEYSAQNNEELTQLKTFSRGFMTCTRSGVFNLWVYNSNKEESLFIFQRNWSSEKNLQVVDFNISVKEGKVM